MAYLQRAEMTALTKMATDGVLTSAQLRAAGVSSNRVSSRCRPGGPWRRLMPGVVLLGNSEPTRRQRLRALTLRFGPDAVITGFDALRAHGADLPWTHGSHLLVRAHRRMLPDEFTILERTSRIPESIVIDGLPFAPAARAVVDTVRREHDPERIQWLITQCLYWGLCSVTQLLEELDADSQRGTAGARDVLRWLDTTQGTFVHGLARRVLRQTPLPPPVWDVTICDLRSQPLGVADAWWDEVGVAWLLPGLPEKKSHGKLRHLTLVAAGVTVVQCTKEQLHDAPERVVRELVSAFSMASKRARPRVQGLRQLRADDAA